MAPNGLSMADTVRHGMVSKARAPYRNDGTEKIPDGDLQRIRQIVSATSAFLNEWDFIREAVRLRIDEFNVGYPNWMYKSKRVSGPS